MRKRKNRRRKNHERTISEPFPVETNVDFQQMFSFPLSINNCSAKDFQNGSIQNGSNHKSLNGPLDLLKFLPRRKSLPIRKKRDSSTECKVVKEFSLVLPKEFKDLRAKSTPSTPCDEYKDIINNNLPASTGFRLLRQNSAPNIPLKPPRSCAEKIFVCQRCGLTENLLGKVELELKSCSYCFTHYCSVVCQVKSSKEHLEICYYGKIYHKLKLLHSLLTSDVILNKIYYAHASKGYRSHGRGCLFITCISPTFLYKLTDHQTEIKPTFSSDKRVIKDTVKGPYQQKVLEQIALYNPAVEFIFNVTVVVDRKIPLDPLPRLREKCIRMLYVIPVLEVDQKDVTDVYMSNNGNTSTLKRSKSI